MFLVILLLTSSMDDTGPFSKSPFCPSPKCSFSSCHCSDIINSEAHVLQVYVGVFKSVPLRVIGIRNEAYGQFCILALNFSVSFKWLCPPTATTLDRRRYGATSAALTADEVLRQCYLPLYGNFVPQFGDLSLGVFRL